MKDTHHTRLALTYLAIIMALSLSFSVIIYGISVHEVNFGLNRQANNLMRRNRLLEDLDLLDVTRTDAVQAFKAQLIGRLVILNIGMLALGGAFSFYLAKRNLEPLKEAMDMQARFSSDVAHELRTPLTAIKTEVEVALKDPKLTPKETKRLLASNLEEVKKLDNLTSSLLRLTQNGHNTDKTTWQRLLVNKLIASAIERVKAAADKRQIAIDVKDLSGFYINGDKLQLEELFTIILDNAVKYGKDKMSVDISAEVSNHGVTTIHIRDEGIGIKPGDLQHIFERFYRSDQSRTKNAQSGYGLGLSLAELIAKAHGASISVKSQEGQGSTFSLTFPKLA